VRAADGVVSRAQFEQVAPDRGFGRSGEAREHGERSDVVIPQVLQDQRMPLGRQQRALAGALIGALTRLLAGLAGP
jgi:hypothetical protein